MYDLPHVTYFLLSSHALLMFHSQQCRDAGLIEYILASVDVGAITKNSYAFIFYTGKRELVLPKQLPVNVFILRSRPNLENIITGIVTAIHSGEGLPEEMYERQKKMANAPFRKRMMIALFRVTQIYDEDEMFHYAVKATENAVMRMQDVDLQSCCSSDCDLEEYGITKLQPASRLSSVIPYGEVSLLGLDAMISRFLGVIGEYSHSDLEDLFNAIDSNRSGFIDREEFSALLRMAKSKNVMNRASSRDLFSSMIALGDMEAALTSSMQNSRASFSTGSSHGGHQSVFGDSNTVCKYMNKLMDDSGGGGEKPLEDWSIFYCGGSTAIKRDLKQISKRYGIGFAVEKFDW